MEKRPSPAQVAEAFLAAWSSGDIPTARALCHGDLHFKVAHRESGEVAQVEAVYRPELVGGDVIFVDFDLVASKL